MKGELVQSIDITKTILNAAGVDPVHELHGKDLLGPEVKQRKLIFAARDKMDDTHDAMRMVRSQKYRLDKVFARYLELWRNVAGISREGVDVH